LRGCGAADDLPLFAAICVSEGQIAITFAVKIRANAANRPLAAWHRFCSRFRLEA
jgi:hypothetical protein